MNTKKNEGKGRKEWEEEMKRSGKDMKKNADSERNNGREERGVRGLKKMYMGNYKSIEKH